MSTYRAPLRDMQFALRELAGIDGIAALPGCEETLDVLDSVLEEAAAFASGVLDPLNRIGDTEGCTWNAGEVTTPQGFKDAYKQFADAGWIGLPVPAEYGGQGLPQILLGPTLEMWNAANIGFANGPLLNQGAIEAIELVGSEEQKKRFIPNLVSGKWTGTMCLTEPQAGSDLAQVRTRAVPEGEHYLHQRHEDLHHVRRARHGREHHPSRAGASARCAGRHEGHLALHRAEVPRQRRRQLRRTQRRRLREHRAQARHQRQSDVYAQLRREGRARSATSSASRIAGSSTCSS